MLTERDRATADLVGRFGLLSRDQLMTLAPFGSVTRANMRLAALVNTRVLARKVMPVYPGQGSAQSLYHLGRKASGVVSLDQRRVTAQIRQTSRWELRQVEHVLAANQILVEFVAALRAPGDAMLQALHSELELRRIFTGSDFVPDGRIAWSVGGRRFNCFTEVDLGHEGLPQWRSKVLAYLNYADSGVHQERFGFGGFRVMVLARSAARLKNLRQIATPAGRLFLFAELGSISRANLFSPIWLPAAGTQPLTLAEA